MGSILLLLIVAAFGTCSPPLTLAWNSGSFRFDEAELARLTRGEVLIRADSSADRHKGKVQAAILIEVPVEQLWEIMTDYPSTPEFIPGLKSCRVLNRTEYTEIVEHRVKFSWFMPMVTYVFRTRNQRPNRIDFERISGDLNVFEGSWFFEPANDGRKTLVVYSAYLDPGFLVPQWLARQVLRNDVPELLLALRKRAAEVSYKP